LIADFSRFFNDIIPSPDPIFIASNRDGTECNFPLPEELSSRRIFLAIQGGQGRGMTSGSGVPVFFMYHQWLSDIIRAPKWECAQRSWHSTWADASKEAVEAKRICE
jgi:hypothetical protein